MTKKTITAPQINKQVEVSTVSEEEYLLAHRSTVSHKRALQKYDRKRQFTNIVEELAQNISGMVGNVKFPGADEVYPHPTQAMMRFCSKYFPYAKGGPLYVDYVRTELETFRAFEKHKVLKKLKIRHVVVEKDTSFVNLLEQLEEL